MRRLKDYEIHFSGLKLGEHSFDYQLDNEFFELFEYRDFESADLKARLELLKKENSLELFISLSGEVELPCDITNELFHMPVQDELRLVVKFGEEFDDTDESVLILPSGEHRLNIAQYLYELSVLAIPLKRISPEVQSGKKGKEISEKLMAEEPKDKKENDPRWDRLKDLLN